MEIEERFWEKVSYDLDDIESCWPWLASLMHRGYGQFSITDTHGVKTAARAHRVAYALFVGLADDEYILQIDHTCHDPQVCQLGEMCPHRKCCNPHHMKLVTNKDNHHATRSHVWNKKKT